MKFISVYLLPESIVEVIEKDNEYVYYKKLPDNRNKIYDCDVFIGNVNPKELKNFTNLKWLQLYSAGNDQYNEEDIPKGCIVCNASGTFGSTISEHLLLYTLALMRNAKYYASNQESKVWDAIHKTSSIVGSTFVIVGVGDIGTSYAKAIQALGGYTIGVKRSIKDELKYFDELYTIDQLDDVIERADVVCLSLPKTNDTNNIIGEKQLLKMKSSFYTVKCGSLQFS